MKCPECGKTVRKNQKQILLFECYKDTKYYHLNCFEERIK